VKMLVRRAASLCKTGDAFFVFDGQPMQRKCATAPTPNSSGFCPRRTLPASADSLAVPSIGRLRGGSFGPCDFATGCESVQRSWSAGLVAS
jgi:hypothetical protein